jgi:alpha-1,2-mannosyltransferase
VIDLLRRSPPGARAFASATLVVGLAVGVALVAAQTGSDTGLLDLRIYRGAAAQLRAGASIYDFRFPGYGLGSTYPPLASILLIPLTFGSPAAVEYAVTAANVVLWWGIMTALVAARPAGRAGRTDLARAGALALATMGSVGVWNTLNQGQVNIALWAALVADVVLVVRRHPAAGVLTGAAGAVKLVPLVVVGLYGLCGRRRAAVQGAAAFAAGTLAGLVVAPADSRRYWTDLLFDTSRIGSVGDRQNNSLRFVLDQAGLRGGAATATWLVLALAVVALAVRALRPALDRGAVVSAATVAGCASALVSPISWMHHLVFLAFPLVLLLPGAGAGRRRPAARLAVLAVAAVALADPLGANGRHPLTAALRAAAMVALLIAGPLLVDAEAGQPSAGPAGPAAPAGEPRCAGDAPSSLRSRRPGGRDGAGSRA